MRSILFIFLVCLSSLALTSTIIANASPSSTAFTLISINGNSDLLSQASSHSWPGNGSSSNPIIIANYSFSNGNQYPVVIQNTNLYFIFENNQIKGGIVGIYLYNVRNGILQNNLVVKTEKFGILFDGANNNTVRFNTIQNTTNGMGVLITNSNDNLFFNNTSEFNDSHGFFISQNTSNNTFLNNYAIGNGNDVNSGVGFYVVFATDNSLIGNYAINNTLYGIYVENSSGTYLKNNTQIGNGKILKGESYSRILLFLGITAVLLVVVIVLALINKKYA